MLLEGSSGCLCTVTFEEFVTVCQECDLSITPHQAKQLLRDITHSSDERGVDINDFIDRFQVLYVGSAGRLIEKVSDPRMRDLIEKVGRTIVGAGSTAVEIFTEFDRDQSGFLNYTEFARCVRALEAGPDGSPGRRRQSAGGTPLGPAPEELEQLAELVDANGSGNINIWEFSAAFVPHDRGTGGGVGGAPEPEPEAEGAALGRQLSHSIVQAVSTTIYAHRSILRKAWGVWDEDVDGARQPHPRRCLPVAMVHR